MCESTEYIHMKLCDFFSFPIVYACDVNGSFCTGLMELEGFLVEDLKQILFFGHFWDSRILPAFKYFWTYLVSF